MLRDIVIGAIGSVIATLIIWTLSCIWSVQSKSRVISCLKEMEQYSWMIRNRNGYLTDYTEIVHCSEQILILIRELFGSMMWLNRVRVGKLFFTLLYDIQRRCNRICFQTIGYDNEDEIAGRMERIEKEQFYLSDTHCEEMYILTEIKLLEQCYKSKYPTIPFDIEIDSFKTGGITDAPIQKHGITVMDYEKKYKVS